MSENAGEKPQDDDREAPLAMWERMPTAVKRGLIVGLPALVIIIILVGLANHWVMWSDYSPAQLAAAGGWVSGLGSVAAVSVALYQSGRTRKQMIIQLKASSRSEQVNVLTDMWASIVELLIEIRNLSDEMDAYDAGAITERELRESWPSFNDANTRAQVTMTKAILIVEMTELLQVTDRIGKAKARLVDVVQSQYALAYNKDNYDQSRISEQADQLQELEAELVFAVRKHLPNPAEAT